MAVAGVDLPPEFEDSPKGIGDASVESVSLKGGCNKPIDLAMQDMTSSRRSKSSVCIRPASRISEEVPLNLREI